MELTFSTEPQKAERHFDHVMIGPLIGVSSEQSVADILKELIKDGLIPVSYVTDKTTEVFQKFYEVVKEEQSNVNNLEFSGVIVTIFYTQNFN